MSVTSLLQSRHVRDLLEPILPKEPIRLPATLKAPPITKSNHAGVGTAFDYLVRFELERRHPRALSGRWAAELAVADLEDAANESRSKPRRPLSEARNGPVTVDWYRRALSIVKVARRALERYRKSTSPGAEVRHRLAEHCLRLSRVDALYRTDFVDPEIEWADPNDVLDVLQLFDLAPFEHLGAEPLRLNPTFGRHSLLVGGADVDLICGDCMVDLKATKKLDARTVLRQMLCYLILARAEHHLNPAFPEVRRMAVYYARFGYMWMIPTEPLVQLPEFQACASAYLTLAARTYGRPFLNQMKSRGRLLLTKEAPAEAAPPQRRPLDVAKAPKREVPGSSRRESLPKASTIPTPVPFRKAHQSRRRERR
jgi:hypothetical protein